MTTVLVGTAAFPSYAQTESTTTVPPTTTADETTSTSSGTATTLSAEEEAKKDASVGSFNAARAADSEIAAGLRSINEEAQATQSKIDRAQRLLEVAKATMETTTSELAESSSAQQALEVQLRAKAVEGFKNGTDDGGLFFGDSDINQSIRQAQLLEQANQSTAELLEDLRTLLEDREVAMAEAAQAAEDAERLEAELVSELETLREQSTAQLRLKAEAESRIAKWEAELTAYAAEDEAIRQLIADSSGSTVATPLPTEPSLLGYQWPLIGRISSTYGYRIHPIYGTQKLHAGIDIAAPNGTQISATVGGVVIWSDWQGGYGQTVIVDHGDGFTSLYAHMSALGVSLGDVVDRGDALGFVGSTGTSTGNHLHFEIRIDGVATDPQPFLP